MEDVFLSDPRQSSAKDIAVKKMLKKKPHRRFRHFLFDLLVKALIVAAIISINFTLFAEAGGYNLFNNSHELTAESSWLYIAIAAFSFMLITLVSFSLTLQNFIIATVAAGFLLAIFNQFALFNVNSFLLQYAEFIPASSSNFLETYSHFITAGLFFLIVWFFLTLLSRSAQLYLLLILALVQGGLFFDAYFNQVSRSFDKKAYLNDESSHPQSRNIIFMALPNAPTYNKLISLDPKKQNSEIKQAAENLLGFYQQNKFTYYPNAYLHNLGLPFVNLTEILNLNHTDNLDNLLLSEVVVNGYWDFKNLKQDKIYLRQNRLFNDLHKQDYNLRIYQGRGIELCTINNNLSVNRCLQKTGTPINFNNTELKFGQKVSLLAAQWLESTGLVSGINPILGVFSAFNNEVSPLRFSTSELSSYNAFNVLDIIAEDINNDKGNNLYFAFLDMPSDLYIYDSLCNIKPVSRWVSATDKVTNRSMQHTAYAEQVSCLYGKLENFIRTLKAQNKLKDTTIIISGINAAFPSTPGLEKDMFKALQNSKQAGLAIYNDLEANAEIDTRVCLTSSIIRSHFNQKNDCLEIEDLSVTDNIKDDILKKSHNNELDSQTVSNAKTSFNNWYQRWAAYNQIELNEPEKNIPLEKIPDNNTVAEERKVDKITTATAEELNPEVQTQPLSEIPLQTSDDKKLPELQDIPHEEEIEEATSQENALISDDNHSGKAEVEIPLPKATPEELKKEFKARQKKAEEEALSTNPPTETTKGQISMEVKVIENSSAKDIIPPFVLGEIKYQDAQPDNQ